MAPAGSYESLTAALQAGADSVYFGVTQLNMRAQAAANFTFQDMKEIVKQCHQRGARAYLAVNTLLYDHDTAIMRTLVDAAKETRVDAIIAFDFACLQYCKEVGIPVHASVQFSISNYESLAFFAQWTNRVVLARELTLNQIRAIYERIHQEQLLGSEGRLMEIEAFAHGALCVAQSGRCWMSLYTDNASANRGACRQNCRHAYKVTDMETGKELVIDNQFVMSAADICTIDFVDKLLEAGVKVLKIEGRGRAPEYVFTVVHAYKEALKSIEKGTYTPEKKRELLQSLKKVYHRGLSRGNYYYLGKDLNAWSTTYGSQAEEEKEFLGTITHFYPKAGVAELTLRAGSLRTGDEVYIIGKETGVVREPITELRVGEGERTSHVSKGAVTTFPLTKRVRRNDKVYRIKKRATPQTASPKA